MKQNKTKTSGMLLEKKERTRLLKLSGLLKEGMDPDFGGDEEELPPDDGLGSGLDSTGSGPVDSGLDSAPSDLGGGLGGEPSLSPEVMKLAQALQKLVDNGEVSLSADETEMVSSSDMDQNLDSTPGPEMDGESSETPSPSPSPESTDEDPDYDSLEEKLFERVMRRVKAATNPKKK